MASKKAVVFRQSRRFLLICDTLADNLSPIHWSQRLKSIDEHLDSITGLHQADNVSLVYFFLRTKRTSITHLFVNPLPERFKICHKVEGQRVAAP